MYKLSIEEQQVTYEKVTLPKYPTRVDLRNARLWGADFREADFRGANFWEADFAEADLWGVNLRNADLYGANLRNADLRYVDFKGADFRRAKMQDIQLTDEQKEQLLLENLHPELVSQIQKYMRLTGIALWKEDE